MNFVRKLEKRFGRFAIPHLMRYIILCYAIGYVIQMIGSATNSDVINYLTLDPYQILHGQVWRLVSWVLIPPTSTSVQYFIFAIIMMVLYYQLGGMLERSWGTFRFNLYMFGGMFFTVIGTFAVYFISIIQGNASGVISGELSDTYAAYISYFLSIYVSTYYINMSIFLAFAMSFPEMKILLYFVIPVKMKWMALIYAAMIAYYFYNAGIWQYRVIIVMSLLNFVIFMLLTRNMQNGGFKQAAQQHKKREEFKKQATAHTQSTARHKCVICGRTELTNPELDFRYCSKCNGNFEYCSEHLYTHQHVK